jgi:hypothetical protein
MLAANGIPINLANVTKTPLSSNNVSSPTSRSWPITTPGPALKSGSESNQLPCKLVILGDNLLPKTLTTHLFSLREDALASTSIRTLNSTPSPGLLLIAIAIPD